MKLFGTLLKKPAVEVEDHAVLLDETYRERMMTDEALSTVTGLALVPENLQLRLRLAVSRERVRADRRWTGRLAHRLHLLRENTFRSFPMQGVAVSAAVLVVLGVGVTLGAITPQQAVEANDIPLTGFSTPRYLYTSAVSVRPVVSTDHSPLRVEAKVDNTGRVYEYRMLSGTLTPSSEDALRERMLGSVFKPASFFGEPVRGTVVLTFADVDVHG